MWRCRVFLVTLAAVMVTAGCSTDPHRTDDPSPHRPLLSPPADELTVVTGESATDQALEVSRALYERTPVVVLAGADEPAHHEEAAGAAVGLGVPLLLTSATDPAHTAVREELGRLGTEVVLTVGDAATTWARALGGEMGVVPAGPASTARPAALSTSPAVDLPELPPVEPAEPLGSVMVLTTGEAGAMAATATARAAGARVLVTDGTDPRADPDLISALVEQPPTHTIALGAAFGPADRLRARLAVAGTGVHLPGGGQVLFPGRRLVALYGHPGDTGLGSLGEQPLDGAISRAQRVAASYQDLVDEPVVPAMEIITTVASAGPGPEGDYSRRTPVETLRPWIDAAREAGVYVVLDLQPGHTDFLTQAKEYEELLVEPHVGLALDPEWRLAPGQRHMVQIGSVNTDEVNQVVEWLADLTAAHRLPQKLLILHQFTLSMIGDRAALDTDRDELAIMIHADGFGTPGQKLETWRALHRDAPRVWWGWKNFYDEDRPTFSPAETVAIDPSPRFISYQ
jgi:hypothetical protein